MAQIEHPARVVDPDAGAPELAQLDEYPPIPDPELDDYAALLAEARDIEVPDLHHRLATAVDPAIVDLGEVVVWHGHAEVRLPGVASPRYVRRGAMIGIMPPRMSTTRKSPRGLSWNQCGRYRPRSRSRVMVEKFPGRRAVFEPAALANMSAALPLDACSS